MLRRIVSNALLPSPSGIFRVGNELFVSCGNHTIVKLSLSERRNQMALFCGQGNASGNQDGVVSSARFHSPHGLVNMGSSLIVCDTGKRSVRVISKGKPFKEVSAAIYSYMLSFLTLMSLSRNSWEEFYRVIRNIRQACRVSDNRGECKQKKELVGFQLRDLIKLSHIAQGNHS